MIIETTYGLRSTYMPLLSRSLPFQSPLIYFAFQQCTVCILRLLLHGHIILCMNICMYVCVLVPESAKVHAYLSPLHRQLASRNRHKCCSHIASSVTQLRRAAFLLGLQHDSRAVRILGKLALLCFSRVTTLCVDVRSYG